MTRHVAIGVSAGAEFDVPMQNRFILWRTWAEALPKVGFCLTNPSKAGGDLDDPTSWKIQTYARLWGFGGIVLVNAFSWCATNPKELYTRIEPPETMMLNWDYIMKAANACELIVCGWGRNGLIDGRAHQIRQLLEPVSAKVRAIRLIAGNEPEHPLYLPLKLKPMEWSIRETR